MAMKRAWQEGYAASKAGKPVDDCPYDFGDNNMADWLTGYGAYMCEESRSDLSLDDAECDEGEDDIEDRTDGR